MFETILYEMIKAHRPLKILSFGLLFALFTLWLGSYMTSRIELVGTFSSLENLIREKILHRYDKAALIILVSTLVLSIRAFIKDRKKFY